MRSKLNPPTNLPRFTLCFTLLFGLFAHAYAFFHAGLKHDALIIDQLADVEWQVSIGRPFVPLYCALRASMSLPWVSGCLALLYVALSALLIARLLGIRSRFGVAALSGLLLTNVALTVEFSVFINFADAHMFALLMAALCAYVSQKRPLGFLPGGLFLALSLGVYQSYVQVAVGLVVLLRMRDLLHGRRFSQMFFDCLRFAAALALGAALYLASVRAACLLTGYELTGSYNSVKGLLDFRWVPVKDLIIYMYRGLREFFFYADGYQTDATVLANGVLLAVGAAELVLVAFRRRVRPGYALLLALALIALPPAVNFVLVISKGVIHQQMYFSYSLLYALGLMLHEEAEETEGTSSPASSRAAPRAGHALRSGFAMLRRAAWAACLFVLLRNGVVFSNAAYLKQDLEDRAGLSLMTRIVDRIERAEGYVPGETPVALVGSAAELQQGRTPEMFSRFSGVVGLNYNVPVTHDTSYRDYFAYVLQRDVNLVPEAEREAWREDERALALPVFPAEGCARMIDGTLVLRLSP